MVNKFRQRLEQRQRAKIAAVEAAAEAGDMLYAGDDRAYWLYLRENGVDPDMADSLVRQRQYRKRVEVDV